MIELSHSQEVTKQQEAMAKTAEMQAATAQHQIAAERERGEQQRKTDSARSQQHAQMKQYEDELARKRYNAEHEATRQRNAEMVQMQEEASRRQETARRQTEESIQQSRRETDRRKAEHERELIRAKSISDAEGRIAENRANEDVIRRQMIAKVEAETGKAMALLREFSSFVGGGFDALLTDEKRGVASAAQAAGAKNGGAGVLGDVVLDKKLETRVRSLATATANTRANGAPFRNVMLYGPPGTGKTMLAKRLARHSGLDYALMTGGDVAPLGADAVTRIHELFDWASTSRRGLLLFIDEADAFLAKRTGGAATGAGSGTTTTADANHPGGVRSALNALLYRTGELSRDVVLVIATNRPEDLDAAVLDRMDESMEFGLPDAAARERMLRLYFDKLVVRGEDAGDDAPATGFLGALGIGKGGKRGGGKTGASIAVDADVDDAALDKAATKMDGFSGREIAKTVAGVSGAAYGASSGSPTLTLAMFTEVVDTKVAEHARRAGGFAAPVK